MDKKFQEAVYQILKHLYGLTKSGLAPSQITKIRRETIFFLYEGGEPKKWSCKRPHSKAARKLHREACENDTNFNPNNAPITYDHAIPLNTLKDGLGKAVEASKSEMLEFLDRHIQGVVILQAENDRLTGLGLRSRMPDNADPDDMMARYQMANIKFDKKDRDKLRRQKN